MLLGLHASIRRGYLEGLRHVRSLGCGAVQLFSYRRHHEPSPGELESFKAALADGPPLRVIVHARYLPYLAFDPGRKREASIRLLSRELRLSAALGAESLIVHVGTYGTETAPERGLELFCEALREGWDRAEARVPIIIENVPGGGRRLGGPFEDLKVVLENSPAAGVCLDTAHAYAYGYDLPAGLGAFLDRAEGVLGPGRIKLVHLNDTQSLKGSNRENHCSWGEGALGACLDDLRPERIRDLPMILETPPGEDGRNLDYVRERLKASR